MLNIGTIVLEIECDHISTLTEIFWTVYGDLSIAALFSKEFIAFLDPFHE